MDTNKALGGAAPVTYVPRLDGAEAAKGGWTEAIDEATARRRGLRGFQGGDTT